MTLVDKTIDIALEKFVVLFEVVRKDLMNMGQGYEYRRVVKNTLFG